MKIKDMLGVVAGMVLCGAVWAAETAERKVDVLVVGGTTKGVEAATAARAAGKSVYLVTPYAYLGEDLAGTLELGYGKKPTTALEQKLWHSENNYAPFEYYPDHPTQGVRHTYNCDRYCRLSDPNEPAMMDHAVLYLDAVNYRCVMKRPSRIAKVGVLVFETDRARRDDILSDADRDRLAVERPGVTKVATDKVSMTFLAGPRKGETIALRRLGKVADVPVGDNYPNGVSVLYVAEINAEISEVSLRIEPDASAQHQLVSRLRFILAGNEKICQMPSPLKVKHTYDRELLDAGVDFLTSTAVRRVFRKDGKIVGVETVNRSGREIVRAKEVIDATLYCLLGKVPVVGPEETFSRIVISNGTRPENPGGTTEELPADLVDDRFGFTGHVYRCTFKQPMKSGPFPNFASVAWTSLDQVQTPRLTDVADLPLWHPSPEAIRTAVEASEELPDWGDYDVVIVGGGTAGAAAAVAAARGGARTLVVEYCDMLGGVGTEGMICGYFDGNQVGFAKEFKGLKTRESRGTGHYWRAEKWHQLCRDLGVNVWLGAMGLGAVREGDRVTGVEVSTPFGTGVVRAKCVIDGTGNADIAAAAGAETDTFSAREIAVQSAGQAPQRLGRGSANSDFGLLNDADARDVCRFMIRARAGAPMAWDLSKMPDSRERRRIVPDYRVRGEDLTSHRHYPDTLAQALSRQDPHGFLTDDFGYLAEESAERVVGGPQVRWMFRVDLPLRCTLPKGLTGISVIGLGAGIERDVVSVSRMQADLMNMGYGVGLAAAMAAKGDGDFRKIDIDALRAKLVDYGALPEAARGWTKDEDVSSDAAIAAAVKTLPDGYRGGHVLYRPENRARAIPLLRDAYRKAVDPQAKQTYALALGLFGDAAGVETLVSCLTDVEKLCVVRETPRKFGKAYTGGSVRNGMLLALGRTRDPRAVAPLVKEIANLNDSLDTEACRPVLNALEALGAKEAAEPLARLLKAKGVGGYAVSDVRKLPGMGGYGPSPEFDNCMRELSIARALLASGDFKGLGRATCEAYAQDCRGLFVVHAKALLAKYGKTPPADPRRVAEIAAFLPDRPGLYCGEEKYSTKEAAGARDKPPYDCSDEAYRRAALTGKRKAYQPAFFGLASRMVLFAAAAKDDPSYVAKAEECLRQACGLTTWLIPGHDIKLEGLNGKKSIDLGSSAMAYKVAAAVALLGDKLDPELRKLALKNLEDRVFGLFEEAVADPKARSRYQLWWMYGENNWSPVCYAGVVRAALAVIEDKARRALYVEAAERCMPIFLSGFLDDGYCTEGSSYWDYGYGHFLQLATAVAGATGGLIDLTRLPKARKPYLYGAETRVTEDRCPPFSDGGGRVGKEALEAGLRFFPEYRDIVEGELPPRTYFPCAQVYIGRETGFAFSLKGGNNGEFHNHNDVGSWMLIVDGVEIAGEGGGELYGTNTFTSLRYTSPMLNSYGHPVPVVDGELQGTGAEWRGKILSTDFGEVTDEIVLDLSGAYPNVVTQKLGSIVRTVRFSHGERPALAITDVATFVRPLTYETAVITQGTIERLGDGVSVKLTRDGKSAVMKAEVSGGAWHLKEEPVVNNENLPIKRLAVVFDAPVAAPTVTWRLERP